MLEPETKIPGSNPLFPITTLADTLDQTHDLIILAKAINWDRLINNISKFYSEKIGRRALPLRLMTGLLIIKHIHNYSDERVVAHWQENIYYQAFTGQVTLSNTKPCDSSQLSLFRTRIGEEGMSYILAESIKIHGDKALEKECIVDTTVQEKNISFPTTAKLILAAIKLILKIGLFLGIPFKTTYKITIKKLMNVINFGRNNKDKKKVEESVTKLRKIGNTLLNRLKKRLPTNLLKNEKIQTLLNILKKVINQKKTDKNKIYSIHEPQVKCIAKGKSHKKFEFGNKVSIILTKTTGIIVGALGFKNNPYDGDTLEPAIDQVMSLNEGYKPDEMVADKGYRGRPIVKGVKITTPHDNKPGLIARIAKKVKSLLKRRTAIEPVIGHLKSDHRLSRNYLFGSIGDSINPMLAAAAFNFLKYTRTDYDQLNIPARPLSLKPRKRRNKFYRLPIWRDNPNSLF
jgi:IS5 family transposase